MTDAASPHHGHEDCAHSVKDPVCGMTVDPGTTEHHASHAGRDYHFCSAGCRTKFVADPDRYLSPNPSAAQEDVPEGTIYTCPMHPEIRHGAGTGNILAR